MITNESNEKSGLLEGADDIDKYLKKKILIFALVHLKLLPHE